ncbi:MAG: SUMF1/EgtB/PvdO family nonheme iron enzyme [Myxococcota bacterium]
MTTRLEEFLPVPSTTIGLGRCPVTVAEYRPFVEAGGYDAESLWSEEGWRWRRARSVVAPGRWEAQRTHPQRPVVRVSWWEAEAYGRWCSESTGRQIRLPFEAEWFLAAGGVADAYPWGRQPVPTPDHANFSRHLGAPCSVGRYPRGRGPHGHLDLAGNVWEWCNDELSRDSDDQAMRPWRGASWARPPENLRAGVRHEARAACRGDYLGFRVGVVLEYRAQ